MKNNLYIFIFKYCIYNYNKTFYFTEIKAKYEKNCIYIKTVKYKVQLESVSKIKCIYRLYYIEFDLYNMLFRYLVNRYIGIGIETAFELDITEIIYPI